MGLQRTQKLDKNAKMVNWFWVEKEAGLNECKKCKEYMNKIGMKGKV